MIRDCIRVDDVVNTAEFMLIETLSEWSTVVGKSRSKIELSGKKLSPCSSIISNEMIV